MSKSEDFRVNKKGSLKRVAAVAMYRYLLLKRKCDLRQQTPIITFEGNLVLLIIGLQRINNPITKWKIHLK